MANYTVMDGTHLQMTLNKVHRAGATIAIGGLCGSPQLRFAEAAKRADPGVCGNTRSLSDANSRPRAAELLSTTTTGCDLHRRSVVVVVMGREGGGCVQTRWGTERSVAVGVVGGDVVELLGWTAFGDDDSHQRRVLETVVDIGRGRCRRSKCDALGNWRGK